MLSPVNWSVQQPEGVKARPDANVELRDGVHSFGRVHFADGEWASCRTACGKPFKHHDTRKNRRVDKATACLLCLMEE